MMRSIYRCYVRLLLILYGEHLCYENMQLQHMTIAMSLNLQYFSCRKDHVSIGL